MTIEGNRIVEGYTVADETTDVSPTGTPVVPQGVVKIAALVAAIAGAALNSGLLPEHPTVAGRVFGILFSLGVALGIVSPGWRK